MTNTQILKSLEHMQRLWHEIMADVAIRDELEYRLSIEAEVEERAEAVIMEYFRAKGAIK